METVAPARVPFPTETPGTPLPRPRGRRKVLSPEERARRRRQQHRVLVARGRAQAKERLVALRQEEHALQTEIDTIARAFASTQRAPTKAVAAARLRDRFLEAVVLQDAIRRENERLEEEIEQRLKLLRVISDARQDASNVATTSDVPELPTDAGPLLHRRGFWIYFATDDEPIYFEPYAADDCERLMAQANTDAQRLDEAFRSHAYPTMQVHGFGWSMQRMLDESCRRKLRFHFHKHYAVASSAALREQLAAQTWTILHTPEQYARLYRGEMVERLLQRVGDHTSVIVRNNPTRRHELNLRSFNMMRAVTETDPSSGRRTTRILVLVLRPQCADSLARQAARGIVYIQSGFTFISFREVDDTTLDVTYGGTGDLVSEDRAAFMLTEIACVWFRWENMAMPQRWLTAADDEDT